ncbi:zinc-finger homeodomain protein 4-like isoform X2 [Cucurbita maxima]|uniref:Zinc-finger homeodomain protein 4-like isoform X2 n=1 Tax=Cucurbita maxima TaxID=3661 RepID=A0A6J1I8M3_CUCMA|nr:zinc-finger homeodomain protein 4-like isoform X2 [Cucurbita maxima]
MKIKVIMEQTTQHPPIPIPLNARYGGHHHHDPSATCNHIIAATSAVNGGNPLPPFHMEIDLHRNNNSNNNKKHVKYKECLKNHAASMGGNATDGCGEFMPSGEEGSIEALTCSACNCHRNFHRKEIDHPLLGHKLLVGGKNMIAMPKTTTFAYPTAAGAGFLSSRAMTVQPHHMIMSYNMLGGGGGGEEQEEAAGVRAYSGQMMNKKRFRTKFTGEQKERMLRFAEKVGWKILKEEESVVQQLCEEIGVKRRVLKVWMHNNKHNLGTKETTSPSHSPTPLD